jgi:hypothetical protein
VKAKNRLATTIRVPTGIITMIYMAVTNIIIDTMRCGG